MKTALLVVLLIVLIVVAALTWRLGASRRRRAGKTGGVDENATAGAVSATELDWPASPCLDPKLVEACSAEITKIRRDSRARPGGFGPAPAEEKEQLAAAARRIGVEESLILALRDLEVSREIQRSGVLALRHGADILARHKKGEAIVSIAARHRLPPTAALKQLLIEEGRSPAAVKELIANPNGLAPRLQAELPEILEADLGSRVHGALAKQRSLAFESRVGSFLRARGVDFADENELRAAHARRGPEAGALLTPDFLLRTPVMIRGQRVHWIDAKNYPGVDAPLTAKATARQIAKYTAAFGPGALVYNGGVMCGTRPEKLGAVVLDGTLLA